LHIIIYSSDFLLQRRNTKILPKQNPKPLFLAENLFSKKWQWAEEKIYIFWIAVKKMVHLPVTFLSSTKEDDTPAQHVILQSLSQAL